MEKNMVNQTYKTAALIMHAKIMCYKNSTYKICGTYYIFTIKANKNKISKIYKKNDRAKLSKNVKIKII